MERTFACFETGAIFNYCVELCVDDEFFESDEYEEYGEIIEFEEFEA